MKKIRQVHIYIIFLIIAFIIILTRKKIDFEMKEKKLSKEQLLDIEMLRAEKEGNFCIVSVGKGAPRVIPKKYFISTIIYNNINIKESSYYISEIDKYEIGIYDINTLELIKTLDLKDILHPYFQEWQVYGTAYRVGEYKGKYYLLQPAVKIQTEKEIKAGEKGKARYIWIDIEEETASLLDKTASPINSEENENIWMLSGTSILAANGYDNTEVRNSYILENTSYISIPTSKLPENNEKLYSLFPKLKNISREEDIYANIFLYPKTNNMEVLSLILSDGEFIDFDKLKPDKGGYYGSYISKGEEYKITKKEYEQFIRDYEEYFDKEKAEEVNYEQVKK